MANIAIHPSKHWFEFGYWCGYHFGIDTKACDVLKKN